MIENKGNLPLLLVLVCLLACTWAQGQALPSGLESNQQQAAKDPLWRLRKEAYDFFDQNNFVDALPLLEKLAERDPKNMVVQERLGFAILANTANIGDLDKRKAERVRARKVLLLAKELGDHSNLLLVVLDALPEDGAETPFSSNAEVDRAIQEGEAAFARGELQKAIDLYMRAHLLDPKLYVAPLYIGDSYFKLRKHGAAEQWYQIAVALDPDVETAWRYWGDALAAEGHDDRALAKYIEGVIAEPYVRRSWTGLVQWADRNQSKLTYTRLEPADEAAKASAAQYWAEYDKVRAHWRAGLFQKNNPQDKTYRRSLAEETAALAAVADKATADYKSGKVKSLPKEIVAIRYLADAGALEPAILLTTNDAGIARDYASYRAAHRDRLRYYIGSFLVPLENGKESLAATLDRRPSTPADRAKAIEIAQRLEQDLLAKSAKEDRAWMLAWISAVPDFMLKVCPGPLMPLVESKKEEPLGLWFQSLAGEMSFLIQHPESMRDQNAAKMAGLQSALRAYRNAVARDPKARTELMEELLAKDKDGRLVEEMLKVSEECNKAPAVPEEKKK